MTEWNSDVDALARKMWDDGLPASKTADAIGRSRNSVIARANRQNWGNRKVAVPRKPKFIWPVLGTLNSVAPRELSATLRETDEMYTVAPTIRPSRPASRWTMHWAPSVTATWFRAQGIGRARACKAPIDLDFDVKITGSCRLGRLGLRRRPDWPSLDRPRE